jgi:cellulose biosynthesis protein BcsQ
MSWLARWRGGTGSREPASRTFRYMSRLIERDFARDDGGPCLAFSSPDDDRITANALLMLAYCLVGEIGGRVLVVDARLNPRPGGITARLGLQSVAGFAEALGDRPAEGLQRVRPTAVEGVDVLPSGVSTMRGALPVDRTRLKELFASAKAAYDRVLVQVGSVQRDTRNLLTAAEADAVFLIADENRTLMSTLDDCRRLLLSNGIDDVRVVLSAGGA